jgi:hypothetical protein
MIDFDLLDHCFPPPCQIETVLDPILICHHRRRHHNQTQASRRQSAPHNLSLRSPSLPPCPVRRRFPVLLLAVPPPLLPFHAARDASVAAAMPKPSPIFTDCCTLQRRQQPHLSPLQSAPTAAIPFVAPALPLPPAHLRRNLKDPFMGWFEEGRK